MADATLKAEAFKLKLRLPHEGEFVLLSGVPGMPRGA